MGKLVNPFEERVKESEGTPAQVTKKSPGRLKNPFEAGGEPKTPPQKPKPAPKAGAKFRNMFEQSEESTAAAVQKPGRLKNPFEQNEAPKAPKSATPPPVAPMNPNSSLQVATEHNSTATLAQVDPALEQEPSQAVIEGNSSNVSGSESGSILGTKLSHTQEGIPTGDFTLAIPEETLGMTQRTQRSDRSDTSSLSGLQQSARMHSRAPSVITGSPMGSRKQSLISQLSGVDWKLTARQNHQEVLSLQSRIEELTVAANSKDETIKELKEEVAEKKKQLQQADSKAGGAASELRQQLDQRDRELQKVKSELEAERKKNADLSSQNKNITSRINSESSMAMDTATAHRLQSAEQMVASLRSQLQAANAEIATLHQQPNHDLELSDLTQKLNRSREAVLQATERAYESDTKLIETRKMLYRLMNPLERGAWDEISSTPSSIDGCVEITAERIVEEKCKNVIKGFGETTLPVRIYRGGMAPGEEYLPKPPKPPTALDQEEIPIREKETTRKGVNVPPPPQQPVMYSVDALGDPRRSPTPQSVSDLIQNYNLIDDPTPNFGKYHPLRTSPDTRYKKSSKRAQRKSESASPKNFSSAQMNEFNAFTNGIMKELKFPQSPHLR